MTAGAAVSNSLLRAACAASVRAFEDACGEVERTQSAILAGILARNAGSWYGRKHSFGAIRSAVEFSRRVPSVFYEELDDAMRRIARGETGVLTEARVAHLHLSSGTTGPNKLLPFTRGLKAEFQRAILPWLGNLLQRYPAAGRGRAFWIVTPEPKRYALPEAANGPAIGFDRDESYFAALHRLLLSRVVLAPSRSAERLGIGSPEATRRLTMLLLLKASDLSFVSVWSPSAFSILLEEIAGSFESLLRDLTDGTLGGRRVSSGAVRVIRDPERARVLLAAGNEVGKTQSAGMPALFAAAWPKLVLVSAWGDAWATRDAEALCRLLPQAAFQAKGLLATEAAVTLPYEVSGDEAVAPVLAVRSHYFEFEDERTGAIKTAGELSEGSVYRVLVTTSGGLYRYRLGDRVRVEGAFRQAPRLRFLGKAGEVSDLRGEKLDSRFVAQCLEEAFAACGAEATLRFIAPLREERSAGYVLYVRSGADERVLRRLAREVDSRLCRGVHYRFCRDTGQLRPLSCVRLSDEGLTYYRSMRAMSAREGVMKARALEASPEWEHRLDGVVIEAEQSERRIPLARTRGGARRR